MKLLTKKLEHRFAQLGRQEGDDAIVVAKFFTTWTNWTWYATEYDPVDRIFFGLVDGFVVELGNFSLYQIEAIDGQAGLRVERDLYWREKTLREVHTEIEKSRDV